MMSLDPFLNDLPLRCSSPGRMLLFQSLGDVMVLAITRNQFSSLTLSSRITIQLGKFGSRKAIRLAGIGLLLSDTLAFSKGYSLFLYMI